MFKSGTEQSGRSMVEMLGVLAIIGVLSVAGIAGYSKAMAKFKQSKLFDQIATIVANIRTTYAAQPSYQGLNTQVLASLGLADKEAVVSGSSGSYTIHNVYGGEIECASYANYNTFNLYFRGIPKDACAAVVFAFYDDYALQALYINGTTTPTITEQAAKCNQATNTIWFVYK